MKNLVEQYISQSPGSQAQVDVARKAFKAELKNGPTKTVNYANGYSGQKAFGNFDLQLFHQAYDAELDADGLLVYFDDNGLLNDRRIYPALKQLSSEGAKFAKELWVLQFGKSDYKLVNVPAAAAPMSTADLILKLQADEQLQQIFQYSVADLTFTTCSFTTCQVVFTDWLGTTDKMDRFLEVTYLKDKPYEIVKKNICAMFLCMVAAEQMLQKANATNRHFADTQGNAVKLQKIIVDFNLQYRVPVRIAFAFSSINSKWPYIRTAFRFLLSAEDKMLDLPMYTSAGRGDIDIAYGRIPTSKTIDIANITKFSDLTFKAIDLITGTYF